MKWSNKYDYAITSAMCLVIFWLICILANRIDPKKPVKLVKVKIVATAYEGQWVQREDTGERVWISWHGKEGDEFCMKKSDL